MAMDERLKTYGPSIYGTKGGYMKPQDWGAITERGNLVYLHLLNWPGEKMLLKIPYQVKAARLFVNKTPVSFQTINDNYIVLDLKNVKQDEIDTLIEMEVSN